MAPMAALAESFARLRTVEGDDEDSIKAREDADVLKGLFMDVSKNRFGDPRPLPMKRAGRRLEDALVDLDIDMELNDDGSNLQELVEVGTLAAQKNAERGRIEMEDAAEKLFEVIAMLEASISAEQAQQEGRAQTEEVHTLKNEVLEEIEVGEFSEAERKLMKEIVNLDAGIVFTSTQGYGSASGYSKETGGNISGDQIRVAPVSKKLNNQAEERGAHEVVNFEPLIRYNKKTVVVKKGFLGMGKQTRDEYTQEPVRGSEVLQSGSDEPVVMFNYYAHDIPGHERIYREYSGRDNTLTVGIPLPESVANKLEAAARKNPEVIRSLVEKVVLKTGPYTEGAWSTGDEKTGGHAIRPPYEKWGELAENNPVMYFATEDDRLEGRASEENYISVK